MLLVLVYNLCLLASVHWFCLMRHFHLRVEFIVPLNCLSLLPSTFWGPRQYAKSQTTELRDHLWCLLREHVKTIGSQISSSRSLLFRAQRVSGQCYIYFWWTIGFSFFVQDKPTYWSMLMGSSHGPWAQCDFQALCDFSKMQTLYRSVCACTKAWYAELWVKSCVSCRRPDAR